MTFAKFSSFPVLFRTISKEVSSQRMRSETAERWHDAASCDVRQTHRGGDMEHAQGTWGSNRGIPKVGVAPIALKDREHSVAHSTSLVPCGQLTKFYTS